MSDLTVELTSPNGLQYSQPIGLFINNEWTKSSSDEKITAINPTDESEITSVYAASADDIDRSVNAARAAFKNPEWRDMDTTKRGELLYKFGNLVEKNTHVLATIETWNNGKPYKNSVRDVGKIITIAKYYAGFADKMYGQTIETSPAKFAYTIREPVGVCAQIIPWNYPLAMAIWKLGPALVCGNTVVLKPAELTPLSILILANIIKEAGFPPGVVNIVNGLGSEAGAALASHQGVDKIAFTGSTATGRQIMKTASVNLKNITLETGGKSPLVVFEDADIENAVAWAHKGVMSNQGQVCTATSRILVHENIYDEVVKRFVEYTLATSKIGDPFEDSTFQGPQVSKAQYDRVLSYIKSGHDEGAKLVTGGIPFQGLPNNRGYFIEPTVFTDVKCDMRIYREEIFGPFTVFAKFSGEEEALKKANDTEYGLGAAIFTSNISRAHRVAKKIESGMVFINSNNDVDYRVPFGGVKQSGIGRELGEAGLDAYSNIKAIHVNMLV